MSAILELAIFPMDKTGSVSTYVGRVLEVVKESGLPYETNSMGTCIEGETAELMSLCTRCFAVLEEDSDRVYATMKVDWRKGRQNGMRGKLKSLEVREGSS